MIRFLYHTAVGRGLLKILTLPAFSRMAGAFLDSPLSLPLIPFFIKKAGICPSDFYMEDLRCFNDCFSRRIHEGLRPVNAFENKLIAPCDGLAKAFPIREDTVLTVKECRYTVSSLLRNASLAARYEGGVCLVFRLCVEHYHRYCYIEHGKKSRNVFLPGILHTVRPAALESFPVFAENSREYTLIRTEHFGTILQMEVGAMLVGRICNYHQEKQVARGEEKGCFQYGGSTILVLLQKGYEKAIATEFFEAGRRGREIPVKLGEALDASESGYCFPASTPRVPNRYFFFLS